MEQFQPNANNILDVLYNKKPKYLPLYEHHIDIEFIEKFTGEELIGYRETEPEYFFKKVTEFWKTIPTMLLTSKLQSATFSRSTVQLWEGN